MDNLKQWPYPTEICPARLPLQTIALAWLGAALATAAFAFAGDSLALPLVLGSFGASCLLVFAYPKSPFAQPRNVIGGHFTATLTGLVFMALFGVHWWSMALAVGTAVALMLLLRVPHPPAGSNPLIVMTLHAGWSFLLTPTLFGSLILVAVALLYNNWGKHRRYPTYW
ncbi:MAG: HPP family protein [Neisseria sp.]|uniref:HPP family protein n=1 Tax=Neisseria sp. TaxID=192066 RepID=UPI0026DC6BB8|nr:HPP family protein [Neisseria sp.]MDO4642067.1 HPP family protein [Neisseria sp.]